ncbi:MAG: GAF domain-containing sensor histidine kinase, partial [Anaerolineales bacterium]|nr:GAF domain-containing sensor histidine kinase [Anaerolineales bacterium]
KADQLIETRKPVSWEDKREGKYYENRLFPILDDDGNIVSIAVYGADISERYHAENTLRHKIEDLNFLNQIGHVVTSTTNLPIALQRLAELITRHYKAYYTHIIFRTTEFDELANLVGYDLEIGPIEQTKIDISLEQMPLIGRVLDSGESLVHSEIQKIHWDPAVREFLHKHQIQCLMLIPIKLRGEIVGLIAVTCNQVDRVFTKDEIQLAETIAADISRVVDSIWLQEKERQAAAGEERSRLARDLHDAVTQTVYSASLIAEVLPAVWERNPQEGQRNLVKLRQLVRGALGEMRTLLFELRPSALEAAELSTLLGQLSDALTGRTRIPVEVAIDGENALPTDVKVALYRITQEAFNNIAKHSEATRVMVNLRSEAGQVILSIRDNGRGFDPEIVPADKLGLRIMRERAEEAGARLEVLSEQGQGTRVSVAWIRETGNGVE